MRCPICKSEIDDNCGTCPVCDFFGLKQEFLNIEDAIHWEKSVLPYFRAIWLRKKHPDSCEINLSSSRALHVFEKYFSESSHKYRLNEETGKCIITNIAPGIKNWLGHPTYLTINTKYQKIELCNSNVASAWDYTKDEIKYAIDGALVSIYMKCSSGDQLVCSLKIENLQLREELQTVLEFAKAGTEHFTYPFDEARNSCLDLNHADVTYETYFSGDSVKPFVFYAEVEDYREENAPGEEISVRGPCKISISVSDASSRKVPAFNAIYNDECWLNIRIDRVPETEKWLLPQGVFEPIRHDSGNDVFLDRRRKILYIGNLLEYHAFRFEDDLLMQQAFNYLALIGSCWDMYSSI